MRHRLVVLALLGLCTGIAPLPAQQLPYALGTDTLSMWLVRGADTVAVGRLIDQLTTRTESGITLRHRVLTTDAAVFGPRIDTVISRLDTGMPVRYVSATPQGTEGVDVTGGRARGRLTGPTGNPVEVDVAMPDSTINAVDIDIALRGRLLYLGTTIPLTVFVPPLASVGVVEMRVEGEDQIGGVRTWRVRALNLANEATFWISQRDRSVRQQTIRVGPDAVLLFDRRPLPPPPVRPQAP